MADDFQSSRPCECGQISDYNAAMDPNYVCPCLILIQQEYERISPTKPS